MRTRTMLTVLPLVALAAAITRADGLLYQLPEDGAWARFEFEFTMRQGDSERSSTGSLTMSSVGQVTVEGKKCR